MWKKHKKELLGCVIAPVIIVLGLLGMVWFFERWGIHVPGSREMWMGLIGAVIGGMFTLIGVLITIYKQEATEEENRRIENMPILGFASSNVTLGTEATLKMENGEMITSAFTFLEEKICSYIRICVANGKSVFDFTTEGCLINGKEIPLGDAFNPSKRMLIGEEVFEMAFDCDYWGTNIFCLVRFSYEDMFGHKYYQDLPFTYAESNAINRGYATQIIEISDIKRPRYSREVKPIGEAAEEYIDYSIFKDKEIYGKQEEDVC